MRTVCSTRSSASLPTSGVTATAKVLIACGHLPTLACRSARLGELTLHGVTRPLELQLEVHGFVADPRGGTRARFSATGEIDRGDFGLNASMLLADGGLLIGYEVQITLEIEAVLTQTASA